MWAFINKNPFTRKKYYKGAWSGLTQFTDSVSKVRCSADFLCLASYCNVCRNPGKVDVSTQQGINKKPTKMSRDITSCLCLLGPAARPLTWIAAGSRRTRKHHEGLRSVNSHTGHTFLRAGQPVILLSPLVVVCSVQYRGSGVNDDGGERKK